MSCKMTTLADVKLIPRPPEKGTRQKLGHSFVLRAACVRKMTCQDGYHTVPFWASKENLHSFTRIGYPQKYRTNVSPNVMFFDLQENQENFHIYVDG